MAAAEMFNFLQRAILMPEPGDYSAGAETSSRTPKRAGAKPIFDVARTPTLTVASVGIIDGRFVQIEFDNGRGGSWDYQHFPEHIGFDEEKMLAIRELVDSRPTLSTVSRENALDGRDPRISFRTDTPHAVDRLLGGILSEDWETIAPAATEVDGPLSGFSVIDPNPSKLTRDPTANILFPNMGYSNQIGTAIYAMLYSRFSTDLTLAAKLRIRLDGDSGPVIPPAKLLVFADPLTGHRYKATRFGMETIQGRSVETGVGSRMLARANELITAYYQVDTTDPVTGEIKIKLDAGGSPIVIGSPTDEKNLRRYVGLLDGMRQVGNIFGGGPLGGGGGGGGGDELPR